MCKIKRDIWDIFIEPNKKMYQCIYILFDLGQSLKNSYNTVSSYSFYTHSLSRSLQLCSMCVTGINLVTVVDESYIGIRLDEQYIRKSILRWCSKTRGWDSEIGSTSSFVLLVQYYTVRKRPILISSGAAMMSYRGQFIGYPKCWFCCRKFWLADPHNHQYCVSWVPYTGRAGVRKLQRPKL